MSTRAGIANDAVGSIHTPTVRCTNDGINCMQAGGDASDQLPHKKASDGNHRHTALDPEATLHTTSFSCWSRTMPLTTGSDLRPSNTVCRTPRSRTATRTRPAQASTCAVTKASTHARSVICHGRQSCNRRSCYTSSGFLMDLNGNMLV